jgi:hypothetical protein
MAKHQHLSRYQQGIVRRYYEHRDTLAITQLQELVSTLALGEGRPSDIQRRWDRAAELLARVGVPQSRVEAIIAGRDLKKLAEEVGRLR